VVLQRKPRNTTCYPQEPKHYKFDSGLEQLEEEDKRTKKETMAILKCSIYIGKFIQFIAERGRTKENRVKGNHLGKSDGKKISNISGG
jgi:hypothetical protein